MRYDLLTHSNSTDEELIRLVRAREESAFIELMSRYSPRISKVVIANSRQRRDAEEILMDIWRAVWENINGLRRIESFGGWVQKIAYNACKRSYTSTHRSMGGIPHSYATLSDHIDQNAVVHF